MPVPHRARQIASVGFVIAFAVFSTAVVRASGMGNFCWFWPAQYGVSCSADSWSWSGSWDFSEMDEQDAFNLSNDLCFDLFDSCNETCDNNQALQEELAWWYSTSTCSVDPECFETWGQSNCFEGITGDYSCQCNYFYVCAPC